MSRTRTYNIWAGMISRCRLLDRTQARHYTGKGIKVCARWQSFENFLADMGECPSGLTIEREDSNGDYEPGNCRWATAKEQRHNSSQPVPIIEFDGRSMNLRDWAATLGLKYHTVYARHRRGLPLEHVFATRDLRL